MPMKPDTSPNIVVDKEELRNRLTPMEYQITQEKGTERLVQAHKQSKWLYFVDNLGISHEPFLKVALVKRPFINISK